MLPLSINPNSDAYSGLLPHIYGRKMLGLPWKAEFGAKANFAKTLSDGFGVGLRCGANSRGIPGANAQIKKKIRLLVTPAAGIDRASAQRLGPKPA
jgi:hypothetical protein